MGRAPCCEKVGLKKGRWTAEEDEILTKYIQTNGEGSWRSLPTKAGLLRCGKSCRLRWINYLRGDLKRGNIAPEEEEVIIKLHSSYGNRWSLIAGHLPGRTDNEIKNYWNSHLSRRIHTIRRLNQDGVPVVLDIGKFVGGPKRRGGRTRRTALKSNINNMDMRREKIQEAASTKLNPDQQRQKIGSSPNPDNNVIVLSDEKDSGLSGLSHEDLDNEILCSDVMDASAFWGSNEPTDNHNLSLSQGHNLVQREERQACASNLSSDVFDNGVFSANEVSDSRFWGSNKEREDDIFTFCQGNDMVPAGKETGMSGFSYENLSDILYPNQVNESGFWGSDDESGSHFFTSPHSDDAILGEARENNITSLSYCPLENEFFRFNEVADSVFWSSHEGTEGDLNTGLESGFLSPSDVMRSETMPPENEQEPCEEVENGRSSFTHPNQGKENMTSVLKNADDKRNNDWSSFGLMTGGLDWSWEGFEDKLREMEGGEIWPWILENDNGEGGLGFDDELSKSSAAWLFC